MEAWGAHERPLLWGEGLGCVQPAGYISRSSRGAIWHLIGTLYNHLWEPEGNCRGLWWGAGGLFKPQERCVWADQLGREGGALSGNEPLG